MSRNKKIVLGILTAITLGGIWYWLQFEGSTGALIQRFPDIDPEIVRQIHKEMYQEALEGKYANINVDDEDLMDDIFRTKAKRYIDI